jgi:uncharacterized protein (TIGR03067 family)
MAKSAQTDSDRLQGSWSVMALEIDGQKTAGGMLNGARVVVKGDHFQSLGMGETYEGVMTLDEAARPKAFDLKFTAGPEKGNINRGIYELDGDDWKLCLATLGGARPVGFATEPGTGHALEVLRRGEIKVEPVQEVVGAGPATELEGEWSMVSGFMDGHPMDKSMVKHGKRVTRGNVTSVLFGAQLFTRGTFTLDTSKTPKAIDLAHSEGMHAGKTQLGIYECDGETMRISYGSPGAARPTDFEPRKGDGRTIAEWRRVKS